MTLQKPYKNNLIDYISITKVFAIYQLEKVLFSLEKIKISQLYHLLPGYLNKR